MEEADAECINDPQVESCLFQNYARQVSDIESLSNLIKPTGIKSQQASPREMIEEKAVM